MIENTLMSGQTFQWFERDGRYYTTIKEKGVELEVIDNGIKVTPKKLESEVRDRVGLSKDMAKVYDSITTDDFMNKCVDKYRGMTLVKDPFFPTLISFITSSQNRVSRIRKLMWELRETHGEETDYLINTFPDREKILQEKKLEDLGFGYRADYIYRTCRMLKDFPSPEKIRNMSLEKARETLKELVGVGNKVADCVLLYSLGFTQVSPIDSWMKKIIKNEYPNLYSKDYDEIQNNLRSKFGEYSGYAQIYMFHYYRNKTE